jgi:hypothetical protein
MRCRGCALVWRNAGNLAACLVLAMVGRRVPSLRHDMAAALMAANGYLIVAAAIIIHPSSPAPVPPASTRPLLRLSHSSVSSTKYTTRDCLDPQFPPSHLPALSPSAASCKHTQIYHPHSTSLTRRCCCIRLHLIHQLITSPLPSQPRESLDHPRASSPQLHLAAN